MRRGFELSQGVSKYFTLPLFLLSFPPPSLKSVPAVLLSSAPSLTHPLLPLSLDLSLSIPLSQDLLPTLTLDNHSGCWILPLQAGRVQDPIWGDQIHGCDGV